VQETCEYALRQLVFTGATLRRFTAGSASVSSRPWISSPARSTRFWFESRRASAKSCLASKVGWDFDARDNES